MQMREHSACSQRAKTNRDSRKGAALLTTLLFSVAAGGMTMFITSMATSSSKLAQLEHHRSQADFLAEAGIEVVRVQVQAAFLDSTALSLAGTVTVNGTEVAYTVAIDTPERAITDNEGIEARVTDYVVETRVDLGDSVAVASALLRSKVVSPYQFAVFYAHDAWWTTGSTMYMNGRIHVNGNLYLGGAGGGSLYLDTNYARTAQNVYGYRPEAPNGASGAKFSAFVRKWVEDPFNSSEPTEYSELPTRRDFNALGISSNGGLDSDFAGYDADGDGFFDGADDWQPLAEWSLNEASAPDHYHASGVSFQTAEHGVSEIAPPQRGSIEPYVESPGGDYILDPSTGDYMGVLAGTGTHAKGQYHGDAGLSIIKRANGSWVAYDQLGFDVTPALTSAISDYSFHDAYRDGSMEVLKLDVAALSAAGLFPSNGLIYYAADGASESVGKGLQLSNAAELPGPLTVASDNAVLVQGDYNVVNKQPAAVVADRIHILSNSWGDSKPNASKPAGTDTTYQFVAVTGDTPVSSTETTGGVQNLLKMHENFNGKTVSYRGALMSLYHSKYDPGWPGTNKINLGFVIPKVRDFGFDEDLLNPNALPPFAPSAVEVKEVVRF